MNFMPGLRSLVLDDPIHEQIDLTGVQPIHDSPTMQKHRWVNQLGGAYFIWRSALGRRLEHAGGTAYITYLRAMWLYGKGLISLYDVWVAVAAALVHDAGHWAFSHILERCFGNHNERGFELVLSELAPYISVSGIRPGIDPHEVLAVLQGSHILSHLIKPNPIGADKLDYLARDLWYLTGNKVKLGGLYTQLVDWDRKVGLYVKQDGKDMAIKAVQTSLANFTNYYEHPLMRVVQRPIQELIRLMVEIDEVIHDRIFDAGEDEIMGSIGYWCAKPENREHECADRHRRLLVHDYPKKTFLFTPWPSYVSLNSDEELAKLECDESLLSRSEQWSVAHVAEVEGQIAEAFRLGRSAVSVAVSPPAVRWKLPNVPIWDRGEINMLGDIMPELHDNARGYARQACNVIVAVDSKVRPELACDAGAQNAVREILENA